jgi:histone arginine demethylase JMJD6
MYVPAGWWHAVLNLDATVAVTHNYASSANFADVWRHAKKGRPKMSAKWLAALRQELPDLAAVAGARARAVAACICVQLFHGGQEAVLSGSSSRADCGCASGLSEPAQY